MPTLKNSPFQVITRFMSEQTMSQWSKGWILAFDVRGLQLKSGCNIYLAEPDLGPWLQSDFCDQTLVKEFKF